MPVETLPFTSSMPFRILHKGPDYFRRQAEPGARKLSAVERLEADKAKYVKSQQVALTRQAPVIRKPLVTLHIGTPPARKLARWPAGVENAGWRRGPALNLDILNNLINDVCDAPPPPRSRCSSSASPPSSSSPSSGAKSVGLDDLRPPPASSPASSCASSPLNKHLLLPARRPPPLPPRGGGARAPYGSPNSVTVRRVDVRPQAVRRPRQTAQGQVARPQGPPPPPPPPAAQATPPGPLPVRAAPPPSPAFSSASSRGSAAARRRPALHRSKSDLSDRLSRATADLERFFNYCGLDPRELEGPGGVERFARANSDIVSAAKLRSASTPSSDCGGDEERAAGREEEEEEEEGGGGARPSERAPYGISVIERNARVIKWLYGIRQARDANGNAANGV
ncbi:Protein FAM110B [Liparis tanakae]|uniref:Protein FAM110B n=1 Tax=Liparis tanakae TaxID=230148 RepID=A0A4Z2E132_9TELE|nr:Protein FAM110B [Liparis tanakae]